MTSEDEKALIVGHKNTSNDSGNVHLESQQNDIADNAPAKVKSDKNKLILDK